MTATEESVLELCFCIDENYVPQLGAVIISLIKSNSHNKVNFHIINNGLSELSSNELRDIIKANDNFSLIFYEVNSSELKDLEAGGHISNATFLRFCIPNTLNNLDRVLYLDADLIVLGDLTELWNQELDDNFVAAVSNPLFTRHKDINLCKTWGYFNAGVMLINLVEWRRKKVIESALTFLSQYKEQAKMFDQDALNYTFRGKWLKVPLKWNLQTVYLRFSKLIKDSSENLGDINRPVIVHFSSSSKPWDLLDAHPYRSEYLVCEKQFKKVKRNYSLFNILRSLVRYVYLKAVFFHQKNRYI